MLDSAVDSLAHSVRIDAAVGLAEWEPGMAFEQLIAKADAAMYQQKRRLR